METKCINTAKTNFLNNQRRLKELFGSTAPAQKSAAPPRAPRAAPPAAGPSRSSSRVSSKAPVCYTAKQQPRGSDGDGSGGGVQCVSARQLAEGVQLGGTSAPGLCAGFTSKCTIYE